MSRRLEFFYDYVSTYSYLANSQVKKIDAEVVYRPMFLGAVMKATGNSPPKNVPAKGEYLKHDVARLLHSGNTPPIGLLMFLEDACQLPVDVIDDVGISCTGISIGWDDLFRNRSDHGRIGIRKETPFASG